MNYELFIARRITFSKEKTMISRPIVRIALAGVALGFAVMVITLAIVTGFKNEIRDKVIGFGSHIQISNYDENNSYETKPIERSDSFATALSQVEGVAHVQEFATKAGIIKTSTEIEGVVAKGVGKDYDWTYFQKNLVEGKIFSVKDSGRTDAVLISKNLAKRLSLKVGDGLVMYFIQQPPRARKFVISGIYETGLEEFDTKFVFCDIGHIRKLNDWSENQTGGYELSVKDFNKLDDVAIDVYNMTPPFLNARSIRELYPQIFDWLNLQDVNGVIIIVLMLVVSGINMISALLIIILERVSLIGMLKALGAANISVRKVFLYVSAFLIGRGLLIGNIIGVGLLLIQKYTGLIKLDQSSYYISYIPVNINIVHILLLNAGTLAVCVLMMVLPTLIITKITPLKALKFN